MITFQCACGKRLKAREQAVGKRVRCPNCKRVMAVPASEGQEDLVPCRVVPEPDAQAAATGGDVIDLNATGEETAGEQAENTGPTKRCPACHVTLPEAAVLCTTCGYDFRTGKAFEPPKTLLQRIPWKAVRKAGASLAGLAIVVAVGLWAINKVQRTQEEQKKKEGEEAEGKTGKKGKPQAKAVPRQQPAAILVRAYAVRPRLELAKNFTFRYRDGEFSPVQARSIFRKHLQLEAEGKLRADGHELLESSEEELGGDAERLTLRLTATFDWSYQRVVGRLVPKEPYVASATADLLRGTVSIWSPKQPYTAPRPGVTEFTKDELADVPKLEAAKANIRIEEAANATAVAIAGDLLEKLPTPDALRPLLQQHRELEEKAQAAIVKIDEKGITPEAREMVEKGNPYLIAALDDRLDKIEDKELIEAMAKTTTDPAIAARAEKALAKLAEPPAPEPKGKSAKSKPGPKKKTRPKRRPRPKRPVDPLRRLPQLAEPKAAEEPFPEETLQVVEAAAEESPYVAFAFARAALELAPPGQQDAYKGLIATIAPRLNPDQASPSAAELRILTRVMENATRKPLARAATHALVLGGHERAQEMAETYLAKVAAGRASEDGDGNAQKGIPEAAMEILRGLAQQSPERASELAIALLLRAEPAQRDVLRDFIVGEPADDNLWTGMIRGVMKTGDRKALRKYILQAVARRRSLRPLMHELARGVARFEDEPKLQAVLLYGLASNARRPEPYLWRLLDLVKHPDGEVRREAAERFRRLGKASAPVLEELKAVAEAAESASTKAVLKGAVRRAGGE
jgi:hypothetical protein